MRVNFAVSPDHFACIRFVLFFPDLGHLLSARRGKLCLVILETLEDSTFPRLNTFAELVHVSLAGKMSVLLPLLCLSQVCPACGRQFAFTSLQAFR